MQLRSAWELETQMKETGRGGSRPGLRASGCSLTGVLRAEAVTLTSQPPGARHSWAQGGRAVNMC